MRKQYTQSLILSVVLSTDLGSRIREDDWISSKWESISTGCYKSYKKMISLSVLKEFGNSLIHTTAYFTLYI